MSQLLHELILHTAMLHPGAVALAHRATSATYESLARDIEAVAGGLIRAGLARQERVAVYLPKQIENVQTMFAAARAGGVFVPVNPLLKPDQVAHILRDCNVRILVTSATRARELTRVLTRCDDLRTLVLVGDDPGLCDLPAALQVLSWTALGRAEALAAHRVIDTDMAAILYTSGSTGRPKGVVLSHRNMVTGAHSVASYLENVREDRILAVLPFSFDYGFSQLSTAFSVGACAVLLDYLLPQDVLRAVARERITGLAGVPPLWAQLAQRRWPEEAAASLRYLTNSGGAMPGATLAALRRSLPNTRPYLMYGLTEAFRSTYLDPEEVERRPDSIGKAIPNAEILVVDAEGRPCAPGQPGELVHRGSLVAMGYWNDPDKTAARFKPAPNQDPGLVIDELAVWSGDTVRADEEGFLYFIGRADDMIKSSGYRISPTEIEEVAYASGQVAEAAAVGIAHPALGQAVALAAVPNVAGQAATEALIEYMKGELAGFMLPTHVEWCESLPRNPNGKVDRRRIADELAKLFEDSAA